MALNIKDRETDGLVRRLARLTGESLTEAIAKAVRERLEREQRRRGKAIDRAEVLRIARRIASRPVRDDRSPEAIIGYDERGLPR
jgi:antitoxin VapB